MLDETIARLEVLAAGPLAGRLELGFGMHRTLEEARATDTPKSHDTGRRVRAERAPKRPSAMAAAARTSALSVNSAAVCSSSRKYSIMWLGPR